MYFIVSGHKTARRKTVNYVNNNKTRKNVLAKKCGVYSSDAGHNVGDVVECAGEEAGVVNRHLWDLVCQTHQRSESTDHGIQQHRHTALDGTWALKHKDCTDTLP